MRSHADALRSLRRWFGVILPEPWDVQFQRDEDTERPAAVVMATTRRNTGSAYVREVDQNYDVFVYPAGIEGDSFASRQEAEEVATYLDRAMTQGFKEGNTYVSRSLRIPAFDYDGIPWDQALPDDAEPYDYYCVFDWDVNARVDPDDDTLFTVVCSLRLNYRVDGDTSRFAGPLLQDVRVSHVIPQPDDEEEDELP